MQKKLETEQEKEKLAKVSVFLSLFTAQGNFFFLLCLSLSRYTSRGTIQERRDYGKGDNKDRG